MYDHTMSPVDQDQSRPWRQNIQLTAQRGWAILRRVSWRKIGLFIVSLVLFITAIMLMKEGARGLTGLVSERFAIDSPANSMGFGWLFAYLIMSGSPVAATALTFLDAGVLNDVSTFTMISGSRLGASFIVLFVGFIYVLRGRNRATSLDMGLLSFTVTASIHFWVAFLGVFLLTTGWLDGVQMTQGGTLTAVTDLLLDPLVGFFKSFLPEWGLFLVGLGIIMGSFSLFDRCLPEMSLKESHVGQLSRVVYRPLVMFLLGAGITLISMSVSVSLSILVPLSARGFVRRENVIPYIMGANVTTFVDTLFAAVLLDNPAAFTVVLVQMVGVVIVSIVLLLTMFRSYERRMLRFVAWVTGSTTHLAVYIVAIFVIPLALLLLF